MRLLGGLVTDAMTYALRQHYGADIEDRWCIGGYVLPGNAQRVILKPKTNLVDLADGPVERDALLPLELSRGIRPDLSRAPSSLPI